jgi:acyl-CoA synthetase (AMP-forming)/AMP-acid ligase II
VSDEAYQARQAEIGCHDVVNMQYTSGTTGFPKGVMLTHFNIGNNGYWIGANQNLGPNDKVCLPVPLFHCFGCVLGVMACVNHGSAMVFVEVYNPVTVMMSIERERCTAVYGVPTMFIAMLEHPLFNKFDFSSLRTGIMAGSPCPVKSMKQCVELMNMREVTICYGLTESSPVMAQTRYDEPDLMRKCSSIGKAMPGIEMKNPDEYDEFTPMNPGNSAPAVVFLASDESKPITGQVLRMVGNSLCVYQPWAMGEEFFATDKEGNATQWDPADIGRILGRYHFKTMNAGIDAQRRK